MVSGLLVADIVLLVSWQVLDPLQRKMETFPLEAPPFGDDDARIRPELEHCESAHNSIWLGELFSFFQTWSFSCFNGLCAFSREDRD